MAAMCNIYTLHMTQKLKAQWTREVDGDCSTQWQHSTSVFYSFLPERWKKRSDFVSVSPKKKGGVEDALFPSSLLTMLVVYGMVISSGKTQLKFSRPKPCRQLQQPLNSWVSPTSPSPNRVSEGHGHPRNTKSAMYAKAHSHCFAQKRSF